MNAIAFQPRGFRRAPIVPINRRRRGLGDAASDYAAIAAQLAPGSAMQQLFTGCAANPSAPTCLSAAQGGLSTPYLTGADYQATVNAIASGGAPPPVTAYTGPPPGTQLPTATPSNVIPPANVPMQPVTLQASSPAANTNVVSNPIQMVQPVGTPSPIDTGIVPLPITASSVLGGSLLGIPIWVWGLAAVGGYLYFSGGHHGR